MKIAVLVNTDKPKAIQCAKDIAEMFLKTDTEILMLSENKSLFTGLDITYYDLIEEIFDNCNIAVTVGGDGTIIHNAKFATIAHKPLIGVNVGRLGFAADVEPDNIEELKRLITGEFSIQNRMLLEVSVKHVDGTEDKYIAVNDAIVARGQLSRIIDITVSHNNSKISTYHADGVLFSTPTGSTAYSLSAGGPVIYPEMECILLTPVCPHSLMSRSVLFDSTAILTINVNYPENASVILSIDGEINVDILDTDVVTIKKYPKKLKLLSVHNCNFYQLLNEKLKEREN